MTTWSGRHQYDMSAGKVHQIRGSGGSVCCVFCEMGRGNTPLINAALRR